MATGEGGRLVKVRKRRGYPAGELGVGRLRGVWLDLPVVLALFIGAGIAYLGALPVAGPIAVMLLDRALAGRRREALSLALGAAIPEGMYAGAAALGSAALLEGIPVLVPVARVLAGLLLLLIGALLIRAPGPARATPAGRVSRRGAFVTALVVTALNPTLLVTWTAVSAPLVADGLVRGPWGAGVFGLGVGVGAWGGGATLAMVVASHGWRLGERGVRLVRRGAGVALVLFGVGLVVRAVVVWRDLPT